MNQPTLPLSSYYFRETGDRHVLPKKTIPVFLHNPTIYC